MWNFILFTIQFFILFLLAQAFAKNFFRFWFLLTKSEIWAMRLSSVFLLPGTLIHELSHWLVAELVQVRTGDINLMPKYEEGEGIKLGSVKIARSDVFRRTLIGIAPVIVGLILIVSLASLLPSPIWSGFVIIPDLLIIMVIFLISNTMFSSKKDMEVAFVPFVMLVIFAITFWWFDWSLPEKFLMFSGEILIKLNGAFAVTIFIDGLFLLIVKVLISFFGKILRRRIITISH